MLFSKIITQNPTKYDTIYVSKLLWEEYIMFNGLDITLINSYDSHSKLYFSLTVRTHQNAELWGRIINNEFIASAYGKVITESLDYFDSIHECVHAEHTAVMPNHIHGILMIDAPAEECGAKKTAISGNLWCRFWKMLSSACLL